MDKAYYFSWLMLVRVVYSLYQIYMAEEVTPGLSWVNEYNFEKCGF